MNPAAVAAPPCRFCATALTTTFVDLGATPLSNAYVDASQLDRPDPRYPLHARVCSNCFLVQVDDVISAGEIFSDYAYFSSYSDSWVEHARKYVAAMIPRLRLDAASRVVEIASNDGYLLQHFLPSGIPILGIEPAANIATVARARGIPTECAFFDRATAARVREEFGAADLIIANNVVAHVPDINDLIGGVATLLAPEGVFTAEFPHLLKLIEEAQFDTIYHEHFSYLSLLTIERVFAAHGLRVFDVESLTTHGGSLRVFACHRSSASWQTLPGRDRVRTLENAASLDSLAGYQGMAPRVAKIRAALLEFLDSAAAAGQSVAAYGAAAKGNTLLNYCGIGRDRIRFVCDRSPAKQGRYLPGSRIPIVAPEMIMAERPNYVLLLPWNLRDELAVQLRGIAAWGGRLVVPLPTLCVVDP